MSTRSERALAPPIFRWTNSGKLPSVTATGLILSTSATYYFNIPGLDGSQYRSSIVTTQGQQILPYLSFTVRGVGTNASCGDFTTTAATNSTSIAVPLTFNGARQIADQSLTVNTNGASGYSVLGSTDHAPTKTGSATTLPAVSGTNLNPAVWPSGNAAGFWYATSSSTLNGNGSRFRTGLWAAFDGGSQDQVMHNSGPVPAGETNCVAVGSAAGTNAAGKYSSTIT